MEPEKKCCGSLEIFTELGAKPSFSGLTAVKFRKKTIFQDPKLEKQKIPAEVAVGRLPYQPLTECLMLTVLPSMPRLLLVHPRLGVGTKVGPQKSLVRCRGSITPFWVFP